VSITYEELANVYGDDLFKLALLYGSGNYWNGIIWLESGSSPPSVLAATQSGQTAALVSGSNPSSLAATQASQTAALVSVSTYELASVAPNPVVRGNAVTLGWLAPSNHANTDWIQIHDPAGAPSGWKYLTDTTTPGATGTSGSIHITVPVGGTAGAWTARYYPNDGGVEVSRIEFTVTT
jgi:hypothetical protein